MFEVAALDVVHHVQQVLHSGLPMGQGYILCKLLGGRGVNGRLGKKLFRGKNEKGERKTKEKYIKNGGKGLENESFWVINPNIFAGGLPTPLQTYPSGEKIYIKRGNGNDRSLQYISLQ